MRNSTNLLGSRLGGSLRGRLSSSLGWGNRLGFLAILLLLCRSSLTLPLLLLNDKISTSSSVYANCK